MQLEFSKEIYAIIGLIAGSTIMVNLIFQLTDFKIRGIK